MPFVNEYIPEADYDKYDLRRICGEQNYVHRGDMHSRSWTIDREREAFIIKTWSHHEAEFAGWAFYWQGEWIFFLLKVADAWDNKIADECRDHYQIKEFVVPPVLESQREDLIADFRGLARLTSVAACFAKQRIAAPPLSSSRNNRHDLYRF